MTQKFLCTRAAVRAKVNLVVMVTVNANQRRLFVVSGEAGANNNADAKLLRVCLRLEYQHERIIKFTINQIAKPLACFHFL